MFWRWRRWDARPAARVAGALYAAARRADTAEAKALRLLRVWLSPEQRADFDSRRYFDVIGNASGRWYRIYHRPSMNVYELETKIGWCFAPAGRLVPGDVMLAQKIALETSELQVRAIANQFNPAALQGGPMRLGQ